MKKTVVYFLILFCFMISGIIFIADYYRATFVSSEDESILDDVSVLNESESEDPAISDLEKSGHAKLRIFGEILAHESVLNDANLKAGGTGDRTEYSSGFDFKPMLSNVENAIKSADFAICNVSSVIGANDAPEALSGYPKFNSPKKLGDDLLCLGFDGVNIVGNHMLDMTERGLMQSLNYWKSKCVSLIGIDENLQNKNYQNFVTDINGIRIGFLSYTENTNGIISNSTDDIIPYSTFRSSVVLKNKLFRDVQEVRKISDVVIVFMNWGNECGFEVSDLQIETSQILADAGADVIVGIGPKVIQKITWLNQGDSKNKTLCAYSLGNLLCSMKYTDNLFGGYLSFDLNKNETGDIVIENVLFTPTVIHYDEEVRNIKVYLLEDYNEQIFFNHGSNLLYGMGAFNRFYDILYKQVPSEHLPGKLR